MFEIKFYLRSSHIFDQGAITESAAKELSSGPNQVSRPRGGMSFKNEFQLWKNRLQEGCALEWNVLENNINKNYLIGPKMI